MTTEKPGPIILLLSLLAVQCLVFVFSKWPQQFGGDELYYVPRAARLAKAGMKFELLRTDIYRPQGYPVFIALSNFGNNEFDNNIRYRCAVIQLLLAIGVILCFYRIASLAANSSGRLYFIAFLLGIQPWVFSFSRILYPDSLTGSFLTFGLLGLFAFVRANRPASAYGFFFLSGLFFAISIMLRPEMFVMAPLLFLVAFGLRWKDRIPLSMTLTVAFILVASISFLSGYRLLSKEKIGMFGKYSLSRPGGMNWVQTWFATEGTGFKNFLYPPFLSRSRFDRCPDRAFSDEYERSEIRKACDLSEQRREYDREVDDIFRKIAEKRRRENFFRHSVLTKSWGVAHLWLNRETSEQWVHLLRHNKFLSSVFFWGFFALKLLLFSLAGLSVLQVFRYHREKKLRWYHLLTILMIVCVVARTLIMGGTIGYLHRYAAVAWPAMLWCAVSGCLDFRSDLFTKIMRK